MIIDDTENVFTYFIDFIDSHTLLELENLYIRMFCCICMSLNFYFMQFS